MKYNTQISFLLFVVPLLFLGCGGNGPEGSPPAKEKARNVIILLDLSDRVKLEHQLEKDQAIIKAVLDAFEARQRTKAFLASKDLLRLAIAQEPGVLAVTNDDLLIDMGTIKRDKQSISLGKPYFVERRNAFEKAVEEIYADAQKAPNTGADIYSFFCTELATKYLDTSKVTKLIVVTDGYLLFDRKYLSQRPECTYMRRMDQLREQQEDWRTYFEERELALCPCERPLPSVEVLLLETATKNKGLSVFEFDIVEHYWKTWFDGMGINSTIYPQEDKVEEIKRTVTGFLTAAD